MDFFVLTAASVFHTVVIVQGLVQGKDKGFNLVVLKIQDSSQPTAEFGVSFLSAAS